MVRFKNRWFLVELISAGPRKDTYQPLNSRQIWPALKQSVLEHFGDTGWGAVGLTLTIKYHSPTTNICIIRVARDHHRIAWGAITLLQSIEGQNYIPYVIRVSGTIKHAQLAAIAHNREIIARFRARAMTPAAYVDSFEDYLESSTATIKALQD